jgi:hypothetical protein
MALVKFTIGETEVQAEWNNSETARRLFEALPFEASGNYWGGEFYFRAPVKAPPEKDAKEVVEAGTVAYWPDGACLCLFWGPTPASQGEECRAASEVNIVGRVLDPALLRKLKGRRVRVEAVPS